MIRTKPLTRKAPLRCSGKRMKSRSCSRAKGDSGMSLELRDFAIRELGCTCCFLTLGREGVGCDKHHLNQNDQPGGKRRGERFTVGACKWHHTGHCFCTGVITDCGECRELYGPSWYHHKREFLDAYGNGDALLAVQDKRIAEWRRSCV